MRVNGHRIASGDAHFQDAHTVVFEQHAMMIFCGNDGVERIRAKA
jgi:hypothetical protein